MKSRININTKNSITFQEPRFISSLTEINGRFDGLRVISPTEYEVNNVIQIQNIISPEYEVRIIKSKNMSF